MPLETILLAGLILPDRMPDNGLPFFRRNSVGIGEVYLGVKPAVREVVLVAVDVGVQGVPVQQAFEFFEVEIHVDDLIPEETAMIANVRHCT